MAAASSSSGVTLSGRDGEIEYMVNESLEEKLLQSSPVQQPEAYVKDNPGLASRQVCECS